MLAAACGGSGGGGSSGGTGTPPPATGAVTTLSLASAQVGQTYNITVYTPPGYATSTGPKAVIYSLDHELEFAVVREAVESFNLDAIVVSIGNISPDRRFIDFDLPGAEPYFRFLTLELGPFIEAQYRIDPARRTLMGYSLSGLMAVLALLNDNRTQRYFSGYVITDPSLQFHTATLYALEQQMFDATRRVPVTVHHCSTSGAYPYGDFGPVIIARGYADLHYRFKVYNLSHAAVLGPCVNEGLSYVFARP